MKHSRNSRRSTYAWSSPVVSSDTYSNGEKFWSLCGTQVYLTRRFCLVICLFIYTFFFFKKGFMVDYLNAFNVKIDKTEFKVSRREKWNEENMNIFIVVERKWNQEWAQHTKYMVDVKVAGPFRVHAEKTQWEQTDIHWWAAHRSSNIQRPVHLAICAA